jgi:hypothetical protein
LSSLFYESKIVKVNVDPSFLIDSKVICPPKLWTIESETTKPRPTPFWLVFSEL